MTDPRQGPARHAAWSAQSAREIELKPAHHFTMGVLLATGLCLATGFARTDDALSQPAPGEAMRAAARGLFFIPNLGQWRDGSVRYGFRTVGLDIAVRDSSLTIYGRRASVGSPEISLGPSGAEAGQGLEPAAQSQRVHEQESGEEAAVRVSFPGSNTVVPVAANPAVTRFNFFIGSDASAWITDAPAYRSILYRSIYAGIDLEVMASEQGVLKYQFHVAPRADWDQVRIAYDGVESLQIEPSGAMRIETAWGTLNDCAPVAWQVIDGEKVCIPARFELVDRSAYRIVLAGEIDPNHEIVVDPDVTWMTYLGGIGTDEGWGVAVDASGASIIAGYTDSADFAGQGNSYMGGSFDAFVLKVDAAGELLWMTFLGGSEGDFGKAVAVDAAGNAVIAGYTRSTDFAGRINSYHGGATDTFVAKVDPAGTVRWMRYVGGSSDDWVNDVAVDAAGNAWAAGITTSANFSGRLNQPRGGSADAYLLRLDANGALQWMTYLGGSGWDSSRGVAVGPTGHAFVSGRTDSADFTGRINAYLGGSYDSFVLRVNPAGTLMWMRYIGGSGWDSSGGLAVNGAGDALVTGYTVSTDVDGAINSPRGDVDGFLLKVRPSGDLAWMTYLGGTGGDSCSSIALDSAGNAFLTGRTNSQDFEGRSNSHRGGSADAFLVKVDPIGAVRWMMYLGGRQLDYGRGIAIDPAEDVMVAGFTTSSDFFGRGNAAYGGEDAFVVKVRNDDGPKLAVAATCPGGGPIRIEWRGCTANGRAVLFFAAARGAVRLPQGSPCAGTVLGLGEGGLRVVFDGAAGANGRRTLQSNAAPGACGGYLQLLDVGACIASNVVRIQ